MKLPKASEQQSAEARSYDILRYKLADKIGIFRNQTESDYGIDFEIELMTKGQPTGRSIKAQVKSSKSFKTRSDGKVTVGGIKQSTLTYWCSISQQMNVIAYAVDLGSEIISVAPDLFWQATRLLDGGNTSKSIEFIQSDTHQDAVAVGLTLLTFRSPTVPSVVNAHRIALRGLKNYLQLLEDAHRYDAGSTLHEPDHFAELLEVCEPLLWTRLDELWPDKNDRRFWTQPSYWDRKAIDEGWGELCYETIRPVVAKLVTALIEALHRLRERILGGKFYWAHADAGYLKRVYETALPADTTSATLSDWSYHFDRYQQTGLGDYFVAEAGKPVPPKVKKKATSEAPKKKN